MHRNQGTFTLGLLLIELALNERLEDLYDPSDLDVHGQASAFSPVIAAERLLPKVYTKQGARYGDAVRRCIKCQFDRRDEPIDCPEFRQAIYQKVVLPLQTIGITSVVPFLLLKVYMRCDRPL